MLNWRPAGSQGLAVVKIDRHAELVSASTLCVVLSLLLLNKVILESFSPGSFPYLLWPLPFLFVPFFGPAKYKRVVIVFFLINFEYAKNLSKRKVVMKNVTTRRLGSFTHALFKSSSWQVWRSTKEPSSWKVVVQDLAVIKTRRHAELVSASSARESKFRWTLNQVQGDGKKYRFLLRF